MKQAQGESTLFYFPAPPGMLGLLVVVWSWYAGVLPVGIVMAILLELPRYLSYRFEFSTQHFIRLANVTSIILVLAALVFFSVSLRQSIFLFAQWLPLMLLLLFLAQIYSRVGLLPLASIVASMRKNREERPERTVDLRLPYIMLTLIALSMSAQPSLFYPLLCGVILWIVWIIRPRSYSILVWIGIAMVTVSLGFVMNKGLQGFQSVVQQAGLEWLRDWSHQNAQRKSTAIGQIGELKLSNQIAMRIKSSEPHSMLLGQAIYNRYFGGSWYAHQADFRPVPTGRIADTENGLGQGTGASGQQWQLAKAMDPIRWLQISAYLDGGGGFLALPLGAANLENRRKAQLQRNQYGTVQIRKAAPLLDIKVNYGEPLLHADAYTQVDLQIPETYKKLLHEVVTELQLKQLAPSQAVQRLEDFFFNNFKYTLVQSDSDIVFRPLNHFLKKSRKGHCEYFATTGALILRAAGIPTRYVSGFLMSEFDPDSGLFLVRNRHAHAWVRAYINGRWVELDFTPPTWAEMEAEAAPWWQSAYDVLSNLYHRLADWWWAKPRSLVDYIVAVLLVLALFFCIKHLPRFIRQFRLKVRSEAAKPVRRGLRNDSPFKRIGAELQSRIPRHPGETTATWLSRAIQGESSRESITALKPLLEQLPQLLQRHYCYRFGECARDEEFAAMVERWLEEYRKAR